MNYEVKDTTWIGAPVQKASDPTKAEVYVNVTTGIVGDTYGFVKVDTFLGEFDMDMTGTQSKAAIAAQAAAFSAAKYPNT